MWITAAVLSAVFAGLTAILVKCGIRKTSSNLATALRTLVVLIFSIIMVFVVGSQQTIKEIAPVSWIFLVLSGLATGASWLCYYYAIQNGVMSVVVPIVKMSLLITVLFSVVFLKEKMSFKSIFGLITMSVGTLAMVLWA